MTRGGGHDSANCIRTGMWSVEGAPENRFYVFVHSLLIDQY